MSRHPDDKQALRTAFRQKRRLLTAEQVAEWSDSIVRYTLELPQTACAQLVFSYVSYGGEVDTTNLIRRLLADGKTVFAPRSNNSPDPECGFIQLMNPEGKCRESDSQVCPDLQRVDLFIVPGIVWDREGYRIGYGGGYFDKLLSQARVDAVKIGPSYSMQVIDKVPRDSWDIPVDILVTENGIHRAAKVR